MLAMGWCSLAGAQPTQSSKAIGTLTIPGMSAGSAEILAFAWGTFNGNEPGCGAACPVLPGSVEAFTLVKRIDKSSPSLMLAGVNGEVFPTAQIDLFAPGTKATILGTYVLEVVIVTGDHHAHGGDRSDGLLETVTLSARRVRQTVSGVSTCWDQVTRDACD